MTHSRLSRPKEITFTIDDNACMILAISMWAGYRFNAFGHQQFLDHTGRKPRCPSPDGPHACYEDNTANQRRPRAPRCLFLDRSFHFNSMDWLFKGLCDNGLPNLGRSLSFSLLFVHKIGKEPTETTCWCAQKPFSDTNSWPSPSALDI